MKVSLSPVNHLPVRSRRGAFSLLEVAIALVIFVIGAIALLRIFPTGLNVLEDSGNRRIAAQMSQNVLTAYNSGDLASTTPDAIYNIDLSGGPNNGQWNNYPSSALGLRRQGGTVPVGPDDFNSSKDALTHIHGEKQGVLTNGTSSSVYLNYLARGRVDFYREGTVSGVALGTTGLLDFRNATYRQSNRLSIDSSSLPVKFRQPVIDLSQIAPQTGTTPDFSQNGGTATFRRAATETRYDIRFDVTDPDPISNATTNSSSVTASSGTGYSFSPVAATKDNLTFTLTIDPASSTPEANQLATITFNTATPLAGISYSRISYSFLIVGTGGTATPITSAPLLPVRAPNVLRDNVTYYVSYSWNGAGAVEQPMQIASGDTLYPQTGGATKGVVPAAIAGFTVNPDSDLTIRFRQSLDAPVTANRKGGSIPITVDTTVVDVNGPIAPADLKQVSVDYNVDSWEYISEDISQFGTPFAGNNAIVDANKPEGLAQLAFLVDANYTGNQIPMADVREIRTRVGNLRGSVWVKGFYEQSRQPLDIDFDSNSSTPPTGVTSTVPPQDLLRQKRTLAKQGRLYLPASFIEGTTPLPLSHARVYYRSKDAWVQQTSVVASHYIPFLNATYSTEPWREYFQGSDGHLYFHAAEAGKTVEVLHGTTVSDATVKTIEIRPDVIVDNPPSGTPTGFEVTFTNPDNASDPRNGKTYIARSRDRVSGTVFDVRRPTGTSGVSVRTLWLNNDRYAQEIAQ